MRGHIRKRNKKGEKGGYSIVLDAGTDDKGRRKQKWIPVKGTKKDAERKLAEILHQLDTGTFVEPAKITVGVFLDKWLKDYAKPNLTPMAYQRYEVIVRNHLIPGLGGTPLARLRPTHVQAFLASCQAAGLQPRTVRYHQSVLHRALRSAISWGLISQNPADGAELPTARHPEFRVWDEAEVTRYLEAAKDTPYHMLFHLALFTGMRRSELLALRWRDVDLEQAVIHVSRSLHYTKDHKWVFESTKTDRGRRSVDLVPATALLLRDHRQRQAADHIGMEKPLTNDDLIFESYRGLPVKPDTVSQAWRDLADRAGLKRIRFHDARHTHATILLKLGVHPKMVQERLGHADIAMTMDIYSHVTPGMQKAAIEKLAESFEPYGL